jgi:hypothetical protein
MLVLEKFLDQAQWSHGAVTFLTIKTLHPTGEKSPITLKMPGTEILSVIGLFSPAIN